MMSGIVQEKKLEKQIEKQMGCMTGFLQIFDRHQILTGKRIYTKRLPPITGIDAVPEPEKFIRSPVISKELEKFPQTKPLTLPSPERLKPSPVPEVAFPTEMPPRSPLPLSVMELKEGTGSTWKFRKETPRLSLDSRATVDATGSLHPREIRTNAVLSANRCENAGDGAAGDNDDDKQRRSPSVIARLMGLEPLSNPTPEPVKNAELRRSASESRVSRDLFQYRFIDGNNFQRKQQNQSHSNGANITSNVTRNNPDVECNCNESNVRPVDPMEYSSGNVKYEAPKASNRGIGGSPWKSPQQRKSFFDTADHFPEPKQTVSIYREIEKRLKMRGINEASEDLETLKQILEALQLKGLLHSKKPSEQISHRNIVYNRCFPSNESPIVIIKPSKSPVRAINRRIVNDAPPSGSRFKAGNHRNVNLTGEGSPLVSPRRERPVIDRNVQSPTTARNSSSPTRSESSSRRSNLPVKPKPMSVETQRKVNDSTEQRRVPLVHSPKLSTRRNNSDPTVTSRSPRNRKSMTGIYSKEKITTIVTEDESSSISESTASTSSRTDTERSKKEEYKEGRSLLERCDKLLHSIAEMTATDLQPSPVSVLDSSFYKDESFSPSPVMKRSIDFEDQSVELEEELWNLTISPIHSKSEDYSDEIDCDFIYISDILRASIYLPEDSDIFLLLEKQQYIQGKDTSKVSSLQRKLIFDTITEILGRNRQLPSWKAFSWTNSSITTPSLQKIWSEFQRIRERDTAEDLFEIICGLLRKDLAGESINGWGECTVEFSESVLDIERLIFKDLIGETIRDVAVFAGKNTVSAPCRKLDF